MKKKVISLLIAASLLCSSICNVCFANNSQENALLDAFIEQVVGYNSDYLYFLPDDYDNNGTLEAFGITGWGLGEETHSNVDIWFINSNKECSLVASDLYGFLRDTIDTGKGKFIIWEKSAGGSGSSSYLFGCKGTFSHSPSISGKYEYFRQENDRFFADKSDFSKGYHDWIIEEFIFNSATAEFAIDAKTENIDLDYLTKYYWYYDCGNYTKYQFNKDGTYITFDYEGNIYEEGQRYSLENNILTFHDEWGDSSWIYVDKSYDDALSYHPEGEKVFFAPDTGYENIANTHEEVPVEKEIKVVLNGEEIEFDQPPINTPEGRLLVPIRKIAESMDKIVLYSEATKTAFIDNSTTALIVPMFEKTMYLANENGINYWENVELDVPAIESNGRILVPVRAFCESLGATVIWEDDIKTAFITYDDSIVSERMNDMLFDSINLVWYMERLDALWSTEEFPFDDYSVVIDDFYINRPYGVDAINMGLSDPFAGIQDLISMTNGSDNATNIILQSMQEILSEVPSGTDLNFDAGIVKALKEMVASGVDIYSEVGGLGYKLRSYSDAFVFLDDALLDYSNNYHSTVSGIFDLSVFTLEELAYLLTEYQTNVEYLDIFENKLKEAGYSDETIEKSVSLLRTQYTNKFIGVMLDLRSACVEASVGAVLNAGLTIAGQSTWGVGVGMLVWKGIFGITGINKQGEALKTFYGLYCIDNRLNSTFNDVISVHESLTSSELLELRRLIELLKAEKITAYKAMKNITWDKDSKDEADKQIEELQNFTYRIFK